MHHRRKMKNKKITGLAFLLFGIMLVSTINAFSFGTPYTIGDPIHMYPGETKQITLSLQNSDAESGILAKLELSQSKEIAKLDKESYTIGYKLEVNPIITVSVPANAQIGDNYAIIMRATQENAGGGEMISMGSQITRGLGVLVVEKPVVPVEQPAPVEEGGYGWTITIIVVIVIIAVAIVIYVVFKRSRK
jgi:hypothetical protein